MFDEITASSLVKMDMEGNVLGDDAGKFNAAGFTIHSGVYKARPDAQCVLHTHTRAGAGISLINHGIRPISQDAMHVIDKDSLEIVKTLRPEPGKTAAHVEFDRTGQHALVSIWDNKGALVVYDAKTLEEVKRLPMSKPSGK